MRYVAICLIMLLFLSCEDEAITIDTNKPIDSTGNMVVFDGKGQGQDTRFGATNFVLEDSKGRIWLGLYKIGAILWENNISTYFDTKVVTGDYDFGGDVKSIKEGPDGKIYFADGAGLLVYNETTKTIEKHNSIFSDLGIFDLESKNNSLYIGTHTGKIGIMDVTGNINEISPNDSIKSKTVYELDIDSKNNIWACGEFGVIKYDANNLSNYQYWSVGKIAGGSIADSNFKALAIDEADNVYIANYNGTVKTYKYDGNNWSIGYDFNTSVVTTKVNKHYYHNGEYWIAGNFTGIVRVKNGLVLEEWTRENSNIPEDAVRSLTFKGNKVYFAANNQGKGGWGYLVIN